MSQIAETAWAAPTNAVSPYGDRRRLFDDDNFWRAEADVAEMSERRFQPYASRALMHAMPTWALGDDRCAARAREIASGAEHRGMDWIPVEILLEELETPLASMQTQWLEPYETVRARWLAIFAAMVERARAAKAIHPEP